MKTLAIEAGWFGPNQKIEIDRKYILGLISILLLVIFLFVGSTLQFLDPTAGILDLGTLSLLYFGLMAGVVFIFSCAWLQEYLWRPFKYYRQDIYYHFNQLNSWQQSILYFSVFFLFLFAFLQLLKMLF
ncbi:hypothetical protein BWD42_21605 [Sphingobacterium sp. CZ-UAM]|uniref:hypothetical protein n=1 Tax=Sphingobacterium sp. CZ-UAM TaxID=1933868 RepID=UPI0009858490|nr:hypothetical protein [Sphingobacterium sp. CZ-UAM]OOG16334.1 hypothetical protein BWD42_21605 [Sphingobacterium sp. CZ-UAM]